MVLQNGINANATTPLISTQGGSGVSNPTAHGILVAEGTAAFNPIVLTNGQLLIGSTGVDPVAATLTAGAGITVTNAAGTITVASSTASGGGFLPVDVTSSTQTIAAGNAYVSDNGATLVTFTLPATSNFGDSFRVLGKSAGGWKIGQNATQQINYGNLPTTAGTGGSLASTNQYDSITCTCITAGTSSAWAVTTSQGNITVT